MLYWIRDDASRDSEDRVVLVVRGTTTGREKMIGKGEADGTRRGEGIERRGCNVRFKNEYY